MTKIATIAIATLLASSVISPSSAQNWFNPDGTKTPGAQRVIDRGLPAVGSVPFREKPIYQSRTVITSDYGTSVYNFRLIRADR